MAKIDDAVEFIDSCSEWGLLRFAIELDKRGYVLKTKERERADTYDRPYVIHCKDCKYFFAAGEIDDFPACTAWDDGSVAVMSHTDPEGYCYQAQRKTE